MTAQDNRRGVNPETHAVRGREIEAWAMAALAPRPFCDSVARKRLDSELGEQAWDATVPGPLAALPTINWTRSQRAAWSTSISSSASRGSGQVVRTLKSYRRDLRNLTQARLRGGSRPSPPSAPRGRQYNCPDLPHRTDVERTAAEARRARTKRASTATLIRASGRTDLTRAERRRLGSGVVRKDRPGRVGGL